MNRNSLKYVVYVLFLFMTACSPDPEKITTETEEGISPQEGQTIILSPRQMELSEIQMEPLRMGISETSKELNGYTEIPNKDKAMVSSNYEGVIQKILVEEGSFVHKGQALAIVTNPGMVDIQQDYRIIQGQIRLAQAEYQRQKELYEGNAGAYKNVQKALNEIESLKTQKTGIEQKMQLQGIPSAGKKFQNTFYIKSPISGLITEIPVKVGSPVGYQSTVAEIINKRDMHAVLQLFEQDKNMIHVGQKIQFHSIYHPEKKYIGEVISVFPNISPENKSIEVHCHILSKDHDLIEGVNIKALIRNEGQKAWQISEDALVPYEGKEVILTLDKKLKNEFYFSIVPVEPISRSAGTIYIRENPKLGANTKYISQGAFLALGSLLNQGEEE